MHVDGAPALHCWVCSAGDASRRELKTEQQPFRKQQRVTVHCTRVGKLQRIQLGLDSKAVIADDPMIKAVALLAAAFAYDHARPMDHAL